MKEAGFEFYNGSEIWKMTPLGEIIRSGVK